MPSSRQNYNIFNTLKNMKRIPVQLKKENIVILNMKKMQNNINKRRKMLWEIQKGRFVPIQILLSKNIKTFVQ